MIADCPALVERIVGGIRQCLDLAVVGLSGGADSTLVSVLLSRALGPDGVVGVSMPYNDTDRSVFNERSQRVAERLGIRHHVCDVASIADNVNRVVETAAGASLSATNLGNARSRSRMCVLYGLAHDLADRHTGKRVRVVGTGNLSEDYIGYDTKGGDALADLFPIGDLFKSEVYQLLDWFCDQGVLSADLVDRVPSAGLEDNQTDEGDLGYTYDAMEAGIRYCLQHEAEMGAAEDGVDDITRFVWKRHQAHRHKHEAPPVITVRDLCR
jgi:NAD+ synthase